jgi:hypothetical protein
MEEYLTPIDAEGRYAVDGVNEMFLQYRLYASYVAAVYSAA